MKKVLSIALIALMLLVVASNFVSAVDPSTITIDTTGAEKVTSIGGKIIGIIQVGGSVLAVAVLVVLGIKYMMGSTEEKAEYKKTLIPYLVGAILIFAASQVSGIVYNIAQNVK